VPSSDPHQRFFTNSDLNLFKLYLCLHRIMDVK